MNLSDIKKAIDEKDNFLILVHSKPDGDALGSAYALLLYLLEKGKSASIGLEEKILDKYAHFIEENHYADHFIFFPNITHWEKHKTIIVLDCSTLKLLGKYKDFVFKNSANTIVIDHHITSQNIAALQYVASDASSTSEIIFDLIEEKLYSRKMAEAIYLGIVFDTGQFRHSNTTSQVFGKISRILKQFPVNLEETYYYLFENETLVRKKVVAKLIDTIKLFADGAVAVGYIGNQFIKDIQKEGFFPKEEDLIDLIQEVHSLKGVKVSCIVREKTDQVTFSFRSRCDFNVTEFAAPFGGGGHKKAAGLKMEYMNLAKIDKTVIVKLEEEFLQWLSTNG